MSFRRSPEKGKAKRDWAAFVAANLGRIATAGLPRSATETVGRWDHLLMHGHLDHHVDPTAFKIQDLNAEQYAELVDLVESYFRTGYEYFRPAALRVEDQSRLESQFGG
jgi:hypothetical protein